MSTDQKIKRVAKITGLVVFLILIGYLTIRTNNTVSRGIAGVAAKYFVSKCSNVVDSAGCYEKNVPRLLHVLPIESVFPVVREIQKQDRSYTFCHVLGHELGVFEVKRNPDHWIDLVHKNPPDSLCSNGYIHGIIVGRFNKAVMTPAEIDAIVPDLSRACEPSGKWNPTDLDKAMCYHGMGHVLTQITGPDIPLSVHYCKQLAVNGIVIYNNVCVSGVFMQIFQPLEPEDFALIERLPIKPGKDTLAAFCGSQRTDEERSLCFGEGWPLFREELKTAEGVKAFCTMPSDKVTQENCYRTVFSIGARGSLYAPEKQEALCAAFPDAIHKRCLNILAEAFVEEDRTQVEAATAVCKRAEGAFQKSCYSYLEVLSDFTFGDDKKAKEAFCRALPIERTDACIRGDIRGLEIPNQSFLE